MSAFFHLPDKLMKRGQDSRPELARLLPSRPVDLEAALGEGAGDHRLTRREKGSQTPDGNLYERGGTTGSPTSS